MVLKRLLDGMRLRAPGSVEGLVYVHRDDDPMRDAREGVTVSVEGRGPPWIVVDRDVSGIIVPNWPGRLWRVRVLEAASRRDQLPVGGPPLPHARYVRAISVEVLQEQDPASLFGAAGRDVARVLSAALELDRGRAEMLAVNRHPGAGAAQDRVWRSWMRAHAIPRPNDESMDGVLAVGDERHSPIGPGLTVLERVIFDRAEAVDGQAAFESDEEDVWLVEPWREAATALGDAALALGAPEFTDSTDRAALMHAWSTAYTA